MSGAAALLLSLVARDTCNSIQVTAGDGCWSLAKRCAISEPEFDKFNPAPFSCDKIQTGDYVCCSVGTLPDFSPQSQLDGSCASYTVQKGETCSSMATAHQIKDWHAIEGFNNQTWGWAGCDLIQDGQNICLSSGTPPFPAAVHGAICGPQVSNITQPNNMTPKDWADLNPCSLNACCNIWGQCGITDEFCTSSPAETGAPGTAKAGTNGCISNCGTNITNNDKKPDTIKRVAYVEARNTNRPCLHMDVEDIDTDHYTHIHFGFGNLSADWIPDISGAQAEFDSFKELTDTKRILSFGGWAFSTEPATYKIFRTGVQEANRQTFADNIVKFIKQHGLDGVDFDWEYPGAQDIPGIPADSLHSGVNYLEFLKLVKAQLDQDQTVSIAAPASYWYLKGFPIKDISDVIDYIIYMTYDLHGQWDYGSKSVDTGCPDGNCLRHQVNQTEVANALSMITKAGVSTTKVVVGMPMYGRSFKMTQPGCASPDCTYVGPESAAAPGRCTNTAGYIANAEIYEIIEEARRNNWTLQQFDDGGDILVYNETEWISWLNPSSYAARVASTDAFNFAGTSDWAIDLNSTSIDSPDDDEDDDEDWNGFPLCDYTITFKSLEDLNNQAADGKYRTDCVNVYAMQVLMDMLDVAYENYTNVDNGYDEMFEYYVESMKELVPNTLGQAFMFNESATRENQNPPLLGPGMEFFDCHLGDGRTVPCADYDKSDNFKVEMSKKTDLTLRDQEGYLAALANTGIDPEWVTFGDYKFERDYIVFRGSRTFRYRFGGFPVQNKSMVVSNPKDIVTKGLGSIPDLQHDMAATYMDIVLGHWVDGSTSDPMHAYSTPVFMLIQGVDSMQQAKDLGMKEKKKDEKEEKERRKNLILLIVSLVLMFVPIVGEEVAAAAGLTGLARAIAIAGEVGNTALGIYDTVDNPESALVNILGMLLGVGAVARASRDGRGIGEVASLRRGMNADTVASMGKLFKANDDQLQGISKVCKLL